MSSPPKIIFSNKTAVCKICTEKKRNGIQLPCCSKILCSTCFRRLVKPPICPYCRASLKETSLLSKRKKGEIDRIIEDTEARLSLLAHLRTLVGDTEDVPSEEEAENF